MASKDSPRVFFPPPLMFAGLVALGLLIDRKPIHAGAALAIGMALGLTGTVLIAIPLGLFRNSKTRPEPWQPASALVNRGIYRLSRNPMYLGMAMLSLGVAVAFTSLPAAILSIVAAIVVDRAVIRREEAYLRRRFGEDYIAYSRSVRRWL